MQDNNITDLYAILAFKYIHLVDLHLKIKNWITENYFAFLSAERFIDFFNTVNLFYHSNHFNFSLLFNICAVMQS